MTGLICLAISSIEDELHKCNFQPLIVALIALIADLLTAGVKPTK